MQTDIQQKILSAFFVTLRPVAKILLRFGIGFREFAEVAKTAFVDVASTEYGLRGRPTNISRVAVMTGLTRKEVRRIRNNLDEGYRPVEVKSTPLSEILHRWHSESDYLDESGKPARLHFAGDGISFSSLVKKFGGDIPPGAMRTELRRVGAIDEDETGRLVAKSRVVYLQGEHDKLVTALIHAIYPLVSTVAHNVDPNGVDDRWAQFTTYSRSIRKSDLAKLRRISSDRIGEISESFDDLFMAYEALHESDREEPDKNLVAVGVYYFEETDEAIAEFW